MTRVFDGQPDDLDSARVVAAPSNASQPPLNKHERRKTIPAEVPAERLRAWGEEHAVKWKGAVSKKCPKLIYTRWRYASNSLVSALQQIYRIASQGKQVPEEHRWMLENARLLRGYSKEVGEALRAFRRLPCIRISSGHFRDVPRAYEIAVAFLRGSGGEFNEESFGEFLAGVQNVIGLEMRELWALKPLLQLVLLEELGDAATHVLTSRATEAKSLPAIPGSAPEAMNTLRQVSQTQWKNFFEAHCLVEHILREDPSGTYPQMDYESRQVYRDVIEELAVHAKVGEADVARQAVLGARGARKRNRGSNSRAIERKANVGYYLLDVGLNALKKNIGYRPTLMRKITEIILEWPEVYYTIGVEFTTLVLVFLFLRHLGPLIPIIPGVLLLIPSSQAAVGLMNHLTTHLLLPRQLPKLDFSNGIPSEYTTMVVVPSLLLNEQEVRHIVESLEVRYLGNRDANLHFALLTDSPDAPKPHGPQDELVALCSSLVEQLNAKYAGEQRGTFYHFHRHRVYNPQENTWMGWERKRGKLLDLNRLLRNGTDSFPVKVGDLSLLPRVRYVITLDSDTRLPRDTAYRLVGAMAHPLNRAVIDRETNTVVEGYGILQPRVGISIESARQSRLAQIYSGETGSDIYTRAVSDVYQDLFGEGSFTGKGIYEVDTFQQVLGDRFPSNALLSHDLIEGSYCRAGLISDIELIDDYPSHFSAYCRRMHRWVRGDWQILRWLFSRVPDFFGRSVPNPLTLLSRWKIFDNLRRSLVELNLFALLVAGWFFFPGGALYWTAVTLALLLLPTYVELIFSLLHLGKVRSRKAFLKRLSSDFITGHLQVFVLLVFLLHRAFVMLDAIVRTLARLLITHKNLLEWETAAEAELGARKKTPVEVYLVLTPWFSLVLGLALASFRPQALLVAAPFLFLWLLAGKFTQWINRSPRRRTSELSVQDKAFLRHAALLTWRYFREFCNAEMNWLIPDRVQEQPHMVISHLSPTNLGLLLNGLVAAYGLGFVTLKEFVDLTERTITSAKRLPRFKGHFYNWYEIKTYKPLPPLFVSTVDSGNLAACLWTLKQACLEMLKEPLVPKASGLVIRDHVEMVKQFANEKGTLPAEVFEHIRRLAEYAEHVEASPGDLIPSLTQLEREAAELVDSLRPPEGEVEINRQAPTDELAWWARETLTRIQRLREHIQTFLPWLLPGELSLALDTPADRISVTALPSLLLGAEKSLDRAARAPGDGRTLGARLETCVRSANDLSDKLQMLAEEAEKLVQAMDFSFLYDSQRNLLSIGYDAAAQRRNQACYDLLASEARIATFMAIAKGDIKREVWLSLGRTRILEHGKAVLASWSGTMFEYLMPLLWMRSYSGTLLDESMRSSVACQQEYARRSNVPWGISEAAFSDVDEKGIYQYRAFGLPDLALDPNMSDDLVIAPYATFLALQVDASSAIQNLKTMAKRGWTGRFGYYDSVDFSVPGASGSRGGALVRCWMAHHQGMSLLAACNLLTGSCLQRWFHREPQVMATELLLHEKISLGTPEKAGAIPRLRISRSGPHVETVAQKARPEPLLDSEKLTESVPLTKEEPIGTSPPGENAAPPQR